MMDLLAEKVVALSEDSSVAGDIQDSGALQTTEAGEVLGVDVSQLSTEVISEVKVIIHSELEIPEPFVFNELLITITELSYEATMLKVVVSADCPLDNPYYFINPPLQIIVDDATLDSPETVLQHMVGAAVVEVAKQKGWSS